MDGYNGQVPYMSALEAYVSKRQKQKAEKIAVKVSQY